MAADAAGVHRNSVYHWRGNDPHFAEDFAQAEMESVERIEGEMYRRAVTGLRRKKFDKGEPIIDPDTITSCAVCSGSGESATDVPEGEKPLRCRTCQGRGWTGRQYEEIEYSDTLMIFMLKARAPEKYRENVRITVEVQRQREHLLADIRRLRESGELDEEDERLAVAEVERMLPAPTGSR